MISLLLMYGCCSGAFFIHMFDGTLWAYWIMGGHTQYTLYLWPCSDVNSFSLIDTPILFSVLPVEQTSEQTSVQWEK